MKCKSLGLGLGAVWCGAPLPLTATQKATLSRAAARGTPAEFCGCTWGFPGLTPWVSLPGTPPLFCPRAPSLPDAPASASVRPRAPTPQDSVLPQPVSRRSPTPTVPGSPQAPAWLPQWSDSSPQPHQHLVTWILDPVRLLGHRLCPWRVFHVFWASSFNLRSGVMIVSVPVCALQGRWEDKGFWASIVSFLLFSCRRGDEPGW